MSAPAIGDAGTTTRAQEVADMSVSLDDFAPGTSGGVEGVFGRCSSRSLPAAARADRG